MDAGIADTINRQDAEKVARHLDLVDWLDARPAPARWHLGHEAQVFLSTTTTSSEQAWVFGWLASGINGIAFDGEPADCDWENLLSHFRTEILVRRDPQTSPACAAEIPAQDGVGSR